MDDENFRILKQLESQNQRKENTRMIQGVHNYDVLSNPDIVDSFIYVPYILRTNDK